MFVQILLNNLHFGLVKIIEFSYVYSCFIINHNSRILYYE